MSVNMPEISIKTAVIVLFMIVVLAIVALLISSNAEIVKSMTTFLQGTFNWWARSGS